MLIIGTGGLAGDLLFSLQREFSNAEIAFYNDTDLKTPEYLQKDFALINNLDEAEYYFKTTDKRFLVAVGDNVWRHYLSVKFEKIGGINSTYVSKEARVGNYNQISPKGVLILADAHITNDIVIDEGVIFYLRAGIGHYSHLYPYCLVSGGCNTSSVNIGAYATVGINVGIKPSIQIGKFSMLGTGAVIVKDVEEYAVMAGNPAKKINTTLPHISRFLLAHPDFSPF